MRFEYINKEGYALPSRDQVRLMLDTIGTHVGHSLIRENLNMLFLAHKKGNYSDFCARDLSAYFADIFKSDISALVNDISATEEELSEAILETHCTIDEQDFLYCSQRESSLWCELATLRDAKLLKELKHYYH